MAHNKRQNEKQILLTGFGAFGAVVSNPTERLIAHFADGKISGHELATCLLPVSYTRAPQALAGALARGGRDGRPFDVVWMLGVAAGSSGWRVEAAGRNRNGPTKDCDGLMPDGIIDASGPAAIRVTVPTSRLVQALLDEGLPAAVSQSAGGYLCNHILYTALGLVEQAGLKARVGFLHVPSDGATFQPSSNARFDSTPKAPFEGTSDRSTAAAPCFSFDQHVSAVRATLAVLANVRRRPGSPRNVRAA